MRNISRAPKNAYKKPLSDRDIHRLASRALKEAVRQLISDRARENGSLVVWRNEKVVRVSARRILQEQRMARLKKRKSQSAQLLRKRA